MPERKRKRDEDEDNVSARPFWSGTITFGLVSIPVNLFPANRSNRASLRMLGPDGLPLSRRYFSEKTGKTLDDDDIVRGYEYEKGKHVVVTDEELDRLAPEKTRDIDLKRFVSLADIPPLYFERSYFLAPAGSARAYRLLAEAMEKSGRAGIASFVMRGKEYLVAILAENGILRAETMRFADEVRTPQKIGLPERKTANKTKVRSFEDAIRRSAKNRLSVDRLKDDYTDRLIRLAEKKRSQGKDVVETEPAERTPGGEVVDLMAVLKKSLQSKK